MKVTLESYLLEDKNRVAAEFNQHLILDHEKMENEFSRVMGLVNQSIKEGRTTVVYTRRERLDLNTGNAEDELKVAADISRYLTRIVEELKVKPAFIVAKGGITSSDIGVKGLKISRGWVLGQIRPGIPVWEADENSRFSLNWNLNREISEKGGRDHGSEEKADSGSAFRRWKRSWTGVSGKTGR